MSERSGKNEGFRMLEECACEATPDSSLQLSEALARSPGRGVNRGMHILQEVVVTAGPPETGEALRQRKGTSSASGAFCHTLWPRSRTRKESTNNTK